MLENRLGRARYFAEQAKAIDQHGDPERATLLFDRAIELLERGPTVPLLADILRWKGTSLRERGDAHAAQALYEQSLEIAVDTGSRLAEAHALNCLAILAQRRGEMPLAEEL